MGKCDNYEVCENYDTYGVCDSDPRVALGRCSVAEKQTISILASIDEKLSELLERTQES